MRVYVYRNRDDDHRTKAEMHFCSACGGWYGVPHRDSHCQKHQANWQRTHCACRFCCERDERPIQGRYGFFTQAKGWQP